MRACVRVVCASACTRAGVPSAAPLCRVVSARKRRPAVTAGPIRPGRARGRARAVRLAPEPGPGGGGRWNWWNGYLFHCLSRGRARRRRRGQFDATTVSEGSRHVLEAMSYAELEERLALARRLAKEVRPESVSPVIQIYDTMIKT